MVSLTDEQTAFALSLLDEKAICALSAMAPPSSHTALPYRVVITRGRNGHGVVPVWVKTGWFKDGERHGVEELFCAYGKTNETKGLEPIERHHWLHGKQHGVEERFSGDGNGKLEERRQWVNGKRHGVEEHFYESGGELSMHCHWVNDEKHGVEDWYDEGTKLRARYQIIHGKQLGIAEHFSEGDDDGG